MTPSDRYTHEDVDRIVNAAIAARISAIEVRLASHMQAEEAEAAANRRALERLTDKMEAKADNLMQCKESLKTEISESYVTKAELSVALERTERRLLESLGGKIDTLRDQYSADKAEFTRYKTTAVAVIMTLTSLGGVVSWTLSTYNTAQQIESAETNSAALMKQILDEMRARRP